MPFDAVIPARGAIQNYGEVLVEKAAPAILQWAVEGAVQFARSGYELVIPDRVAIATEEYQAREDWLANFIAETCTADANARAQGGELYAAYRGWAEHAGEYVRRQSDFVAAMGAAGYQRAQSNGCKYWYGLRLENGAVSRYRAM